MAREVWFVLPPRFMLLDFAGPAEAFRIATEFGADFSLHYAAVAPAVRCSLGLPLGGMEALPQQLPDDSLIIIPGADCSAEAYAMPEARQIAAWLGRCFDPQRHVLATVCSAALLAGAAGLLAGRQCTTHHSLIQRLQVSDRSARVLENRVFVQDGPLWTSAGITAGIDLALQLISLLASPAIARDVAREMVVYFRRSAQDVQLSPWLAHRNHLHPAVHKVQDLIAASPERDWSLAALADQVHVSVRHLSRLFREHAGVSVHDYHLALRAALARQWRAAGLSKEKAALAAGFSSARQWQRVQQTAAAS
ncbi:transcriptional regulator, AraC family [Aquitalea magnusonii]|uniref:Transcriptional regulator, AraC family n=1 Tax=Aquitalea magnusonii TaxID=332411 RepID=A0A3G9GEB8_9NEIS|nr:DJ-1/PfpI family protein [Aquitalea magnusonii]BBF84591.1 transcriptional regulator, AraC family [Aquitalea magnusonii]